MRSGIKFPCKICENNVTNCDHAIQCDLCDSWVHIKCNDLNCIADLPSLHPNYARSLPVLVSRGLLVNKSKSRSCLAVRYVDLFFSAPLVL